MVPRPGSRDPHSHDAEDFRESLERDNHFVNLAAYTRGVEQVPIPACIPQRALARDMVQHFLQRPKRGFQYPELGARGSCEIGWARSVPSARLVAFSHAEWLRDERGLLYAKLHAPGLASRLRGGDTAVRLTMWLAHIHAITYSAEKKRASRSSMALRHR